MSKIDELLKNEKVEWKKLGDVSVCISISTGLNPRKNFKLNDASNGKLTSWYITTKDYSYNEKIEFVEGKTAKITEEARLIINRRSKLEINDILFSAVGTVGKIAFVDVHPTNFDVNESTFVLKPNKKNIVPKYLVYYLKSDFVQNEVKKSLKGSTLVGLRKNKLEDLEIPIPSIETQEKIVKTLDKFTNYVTELQAELQARTIQYEYYIDMLLSEEYLNKITAEIMGSDILLKFDYLEDVSDVRDGTHDSPKKQTHGKFLITSKNIKNGSVIYDNAYYISEDDYSNINKRSKVDIDDLLFTMIGTIGEIAHIKEQPDFAIKNVGLIKNNGKMLSRYLFYYLNSTFVKSYIEQNKSKGSQVFISLGNLRKIKIPVPPIKVQEHIVEILDKFDALVNDISKGLPKEIELRQKQYEYYREKLLSFNK